MSEESSVAKKGSDGIIPGAIACVFAVLGIFLFGVIFVPLAAIVAIISTILAIKSKNVGSIGLSIAAWILTAVGFFTSPVLWVTIAAMFGLGANL